jgi:hypothetical protein
MLAVARKHGAVRSTFLAAVSPSPHYTCFSANTLDGYQTAAAKCSALSGGAKMPSNARFSDDIAARVGRQTNSTRDGQGSSQGRGTDGTDANGGAGHTQAKKRGVRDKLPSIFRGPIDGKKSLFAP